MPNILAGVAGLEPADAGVKVLCLTNLATPQYSLQLATPRGQFWIANLLMKAASVLVSRYLYCIAFILHIYYIINFLFFQRIIFGRWFLFLVRPWRFELQTRGLKVHCSTI